MPIQPLSMCVGWVWGVRLSHASRHAHPAPFGQRVRSVARAAVLCGAAHPYQGATACVRHVCARAASAVAVASVPLAMPVASTFAAGRSSPGSSPLHGWPAERVRPQHSPFMAGQLSLFGPNTHPSWLAS
eukprot:366440-Chlamydomonas_euryale.AAC.3